jgi:hypothetical protein
MHQINKNKQFASVREPSSVSEISLLKKRSKSVSIFYKKRRIGFSYLMAAFLTGVMVPGIAAAGDGDLSGLFLGALVGCILSLCMALILPVKPLVKLFIFFPLAFILAWPCGYFADDFFRNKTQERNATYDRENHCYKSSWPARAGDYPNCK